MKSHQLRPSIVDAAGIRWFAILVLAGSLLFTGCASHEDRREEMRDRAGPPQPPLQGDTAFFGSAIGVEGKVMPFGGPHLAGGPNGPSSSRSRNGGDGMGMRGGYGGGGYGRGRHGEGGDVGSESGPGEMDPESAAAGRGVRTSMTVPRQTMWLTFTNHEKSAVEIAIKDLRSPMGNFAPQPETLKLDPGASASIEPVSGDAGGAVEFLDVEITLRKSGVEETHTLHLAVSPPPPAAASAGPTPP